MIGLTWGELQAIELFLVFHMVWSFHTLKTFMMLPCCYHRKNMFSSRPWSRLLALVLPLQHRSIYVFGNLDILLLAIQHGLTPTGKLWRAQHLDKKDPLWTSSSCAVLWKTDKLIYLFLTAWTFWEMWTFVWPLAWRESQWRRVSLVEASCRFSSCRSSSLSLCRCVYLQACGILTFTSPVLIISPFPTASHLHHRERRQK